MANLKKRYTIFTAV